MIKINLKSFEVTREPLPDFLIGLMPESLVDLSWTDPALGVAGFGWWPEEDNSRALGEYEQYGEESLSINSIRQVVIVTRAIESWPKDRIAAAEAEKKAARNAGILAQLATIDTKSIRALREGDSDRIAKLELDAIELRWLRWCVRNRFNAGTASGASTWTTWSASSSSKSSRT